MQVPPQLSEMKLFFYALNDITNKLLEQMQLTSAACPLQALKLMQVNAQKPVLQMNN